MDEQQNIIIYRTADGRASVALYAKDGKIWLNQQQMAELFATSKQTISYHIINILKEKELKDNSVVKEYLTTAADGKNYNVVFYSLEMIIAVGYRVRGLRGTQFRQWATEHLTEYVGQYQRHHCVVATSSCTRSDVIFGCFRRHLRPVPMIL